MKMVRAALTVAGAAVSFLLLRSLLEPYGLSSERYDVGVPNLPASWEGRKLVLLSDLHVGMVGGPPSTVRRAVRLAIEEEPAAVLIAGDFVHDKAEFIGPAMELLRPLAEARIPVYAVLGNHDYALPTKQAKGDPRLAAQLEGSLEAAGISVLQNELAELEGSDGEVLYLVGVGAHAARNDHPCEALQELAEDSPRVVMMHHPASFDRLPPGSAPFAVAGHTHGGQIRLPLSPILHLLTYQKELKVLVAGWIDSEDMSGYGRPGNNLYVSRGLGCSLLPLRLFCLPELTVFTLRRAAGSLAERH